MGREALVYFRIPQLVIRARWDAIERERKIPCPSCVLNNNYLVIQPIA
jgi:hypothetical protein